jgi:hypothetical protein
VPKVHTKPIKRPRNGFEQREQGITEGTLVWRTGLSGVPPDSVRCTRGLQAKLRTFENSQRRFAIIHRTVRCTTGQCLVPYGRATLNSPASGIRSAKIHRTCPVHTGLSGEPAWHTGQSTGLVRCATGQPGGPTRQCFNGRNPTAR